MFYQKKKKPEWKLLDFHRIIKNYQKFRECIAFSHETIFIAESTINQQKDQRTLKFYSLSQLQNPQVIDCKFQREAVVSCLFIRNSSKAIISWENYEIQLWKKNSIWELEKILFEPIVDDPYFLKNVVINKTESQLILSGYPVAFPYINEQFNLIPDVEQQLDFFDSNFVYNETEKFIIGKCDLKNVLFILEKKDRWILKRQIKLPKYQYNLRLGDKFFFFGEIIILYKNLFIQWNKWSGKLIRNKILQSEILACSKTKVALYWREHEINIYNVKFYLELQQVIPFKYLNDQVHRYGISDDGMYILYLSDDGMNLWKNLIRK